MNSQKVKPKDLSLRLINNKSWVFLIQETNLLKKYSVQSTKSYFLKSEQSYSALF